MNGVRQRNASAWLLPNDGSRTNHALRHDMARYSTDEIVDVVVIGCGAGGAVLSQRLARRGWKVVAFDAGPFWDPDQDWVSDEAGSHQLYWNEPRVISGKDPIELGSNNSGRGVGGSMVHFAGYAPRFHPSDFSTWTNDGVGADWPIAYRDLKGYYQLLEAELPVAGQHWPWGDPHRYPHSPHPIGGNGLAFVRGCEATGIDVRIGPVAITNGRFGNRSHCIYRGFCLQGCKVNAKASPLITHIPDALAHGAEIRPDAMVSRIEVDRNRRATGVTYLHQGREYRQRAHLVVVSAYSIETPRLLLNSACAEFPDGLCNDFDQVGRYVMVQGAPQTAGRYREEIRAYKAPPPEASTEAFYETDPTKPYKRGFSLQCISPLPIVFAEHVGAQGHWGETLREYMRDYVHWATFGALCEFLPQAENRVTLSDQTRSARPASGQLRLLHVRQRQGAREGCSVHHGGHAPWRRGRRGHHDQPLRPPHRRCRMAADPTQGVVDAQLRSFAIPNLFVIDGSVCPTQGSANPALTIMALAARAADYLGRPESLR